MAISTSGVSVPQLGQTVDASIYGSQNAPKPLTIADMLDITGKNIDIQKKTALLPSEIEVGKAAAQKAKAEANTAQLQNYTNHLTAVAQDQQKLLTKPDLNSKDIVDSVMTHAKNAGTPDNVVAQTLSDLPQNGSPTQLKAWLASHLARTLTAQGQLEKLYPSAAQTNLGGVTAPLATGNPLLAAQAPGTQVGPSTQLGLQPGTELVAQPGDTSGLPPGTKYLTGGGAAMPQGGSPVGGGGQGGVTPQQMSSPQGVPAVSALSPQVSTNLQLGNTLVNASRQAASTAPSIDFAANQAIKLADVTDTGVGSEVWNTLKGRGVALPDFDYKNSAANYDKLGHVLAQQNALLAQNPAVSSAMQEGAVTNKKLDLASSVAGTTNWTREGIKYAARTNRALADMSKLYSQGIEQSQVISNNNPLYANQFQSRWNQIVNVDAIRLANAYKYREQDPEGYREIVKELGGKKSKLFQDTAARIDALNDLVARGK
jgi:hypothetical protein